MTDQGATVAKRKGTLKEHLAGIKAAAAWRRELIDQHLLRTQQPISSEPYDTDQEATQP